jgi:HEAT repeat protein
LDDRRLIEHLTAALLKAATRDDTADAHQLIAEAIVTRGAEALPLFHRATKRKKKCTFALASLLLERGDTGCAVSDAAIIAILADQKHIARDAVLGSMQSSAQSRFAPQLRDIAKKRNDPGWAYAVDALSKWHDVPAIDILISHCTGVETPFVLLAALVRLRPPEATIVFEQKLAHADPRERTFALWGLAALGYAEPAAALIRLLDDPDTSTATSFTPGQSMRAAQALADVFGIPFEWGDNAEVKKFRHHCKTLYSSEDLATLAIDLATGKLTRNMGGGRGKV